MVARSDLVKTVLGCIGAWVALVFASPVSAQERGSAGAEEAPPVVERLFACRGIAEPVQRLACFDREVALVEEATMSEELVIADQSQVREARAGLFGFKLPKIRLFGGSEDGKNDVDSIDGIIASARTTGRGKLYVELESGSRWIQTDNTLILGDVEAGDSITIKKAALGSFKAKIGGKRTFRIKRLN
ncbi:hypothetical protein QWY75_07680 [Pontixanthobacter aestiaquae]|uniref:Uncharacterized protein n=1 Tax=Pontixanthobacter aestiaquae TaxID=1509367 RepID=A0A844Z5Z5_9SPHN|nr:hypothetical protein [Pontixanthobacter aestiaquae]MDN3646084.1 hypothetical protein [Pontixanthobacter aestiaquae]MXO82924.1 hypothetical protein [Pontixanthobacter aestiaquae]